MLSLFFAGARLDRIDLAEETCGRPLRSAVRSAKEVAPDNRGREAGLLGLLVSSRTGGFFGPLFNPGPNVDLRAFGATPDLVGDFGVSRSRVTKRLPALGLPFSSDALGSPFVKLSTELIEFLCLCPLDSDLGGGNSLAERRARDAAGGRVGGLLNALPLLDFGAEVVVCLVVAVGVE